jgi:hypothetical protein
MATLQGVRGKHLPGKSPRCRSGLVVSWFRSAHVFFIHPVSQPRRQDGLLRYRRFLLDRDRMTSRQ